MQQRAPTPPPAHFEKGKGKGKQSRRDYDDEEYEEYLRRTKGKGKPSQAPWQPRPPWTAKGAAYGAWAAQAWGSKGARGESTTDDLDENFDYIFYMF